MQKKESYKKELGEALLEEGREVVVTIYLLALCIIFPWYLKDHYLEMAFLKWKFYFFSTLLFLMLIGSGYVLYRLFYKKKMGKSIKIPKNSERMPERIALAYGICVFVSCFTCVDPLAAFMGTDGWYMGVIAQILFVATYLVFCNIKVPIEALVGFNMIGSGVCLIIGICQRFGQDLLHLYWDMEPEVVRDYLSTIGNRTWYSGYICSVFPIGLYYFWHTEKKLWQALFGVYVFLGFSGIVTINSDSAYVGIFAVLFALGLMSIGKEGKGKRYSIILDLLFGASSLMAFFKKLWPDETRTVRGFSRIFLNTHFMVPALMIMLLVTAILFKKKSYVKIAENQRQKIIRICLYAVCLLGIGLVAVIVCNTTGVFQKWFGRSIQSAYFIFDNDWGDYRGGTWKLTLDMFQNLPLVQKLLGAGADCFAWYAYHTPVYREKLNAVWGELVLANAHNEWLNSLFCQGIVGGLLYLGIFARTGYVCMTKSGMERKPFVPAVSLCIVGYVAHNFFCYQQVCATAFIFVFMGTAMHLVREDAELN